MPVQYQQEPIAHLCKPSKLIVDSPNSLLNCLFGCAAYVYHLAGALHAVAEQLQHVAELFEVSAQDLDNDIVEAWFGAH